MQIQSDAVSASRAAVWIPHEHKKKPVSYAQLARSIHELAASSDQKKSQRQLVHHVFLKFAVYNSVDPSLAPSLLMVVIHDVQQAESFIASGMLKRSTAMTNSNIQSSRSQCIINIHCEIDNFDEDAAAQSSTAMLTIVDLAGAEREKRTGNQVVIHDVQQAESFIASGMLKRSTAMTNSNLQSSRSQCIINIHCEIDNFDEDAAAQSSTAMLTIVDLAGAEREKRTGNQENCKKPLHKHFQNSLAMFSANVSSASFLICS